MMPASDNFCYLHNNKEYVEFWKRYFDEYPLLDSDRFEIYIDFPFCRSICKFCVFGSCKYTDYKDSIKHYENAVISLISDMKDIIPRRINNIYFGGGTPSLWSRKALIEIANIIPAYHKANTRTIECHPVDINNDFLMFLINDINIKTVSIGIQSFDYDSNIAQHRIPADIDTIRNAVKLLHQHGKFVNIDIVALFNYDDEIGWDLFKKDIKILIEDIKPDDICSSPNFRVPNYYSKVVRYREILKEIVNKYPEYSLEHPDSISTDISDIIRYGEEPYHLRTKEYHNFFNNCKVGIMDSNLDVIKNNVIMAFGGSRLGHNSISRLGKIQYDIYSGYDFMRNKLIHQVQPTKIIPPYKDGDDIPSIRIGNCSIDTSL